MSRPRLLDLFCCEGGAARGYADAGFDVVGVDVQPQPLYPFDFVQADALAVLRNCGTGWGADRFIDIRDFDAIHASPPCQARTSMSNRYRGQGGVADSHPELIGPVRDLLRASGLPWVLENVVGARRDMPNPLILHGGMFGLRVDRPRLFESNVLLLAPPDAPRCVNPIGVYGARPDGRLLNTRKDGSEQRAARSVEEAREAMGMPWASWRGCAEAIPPVYTRFIGEQLLTHLGLVAA